MASAPEVVADGLTTCTPVMLALQHSCGQTVRQNLRHIGAQAFFGFVAMGWAVVAGLPVPQGYPGYPGYPPHKF